VNVRGLGVAAIVCACVGAAKNSPHIATIIHVTQRVAACLCELVTLSMSFLPFPV
jgi:hypothetical protein